MTTIRPIEVEDGYVTAALLPDGWHVVHSGSFKVNTFRYVGGDGHCTSDRDETGFEFTEEETDDVITGPISSLLATKWKLF